MKTNNLSWWRVCLVLLAAISLLGFTACGDDSGSDGDGGDDGTTDGASTDGTTDGGTTDGGTTDGGTTDGGTTDGGTTDGGTTDGGTTDGGTTDGGTTDGGTTDLEPLPESWPATPADYAGGASATAYITSLVIPGLDDDGIPECCTDYGEDISKFQGIDNALAALVPQIEQLLASQGALPEGSTINGLIEEQLETGTITILWDHVSLDGETDPDGFILAGLLGSWAPGTDWLTASVGEGDFLINPSSFTASGEPLIKFNPSAMDGGNMMAGPSLFLLSLPVLGFNLDLEINDAMIAGAATLGAESGVSYEDGELSGYIALETLFGALNDVSSGCDCLGLDGGDLMVGSGADWACNESVNFTACADNEVEICDTLSAIPTSACGLIVNVLSGQADIDTDADDTYDALSVGLTWTAAEATIVGVEPE